MGAGGPDAATHAAIVAGLPALRLYRPRVSVEVVPGPAETNAPTARAADVACRRLRTCVRMTSEGRPHARFTRVLQGNDLFAIRAAALELPRVALEDALAIVLKYLDLEPEQYPRAAAKWAGRMLVEKPMGLVDAQLLLAALAALQGPCARAAGEALVELADWYGLRRVDSLIGEWLERHGLGD